MCHLDTYYFQKPSSGLRESIIRKDDGLILI